MLIGLISCTKDKTPYAAPARLLYSPSALFRGALGALHGRTDHTYVLSAKYGLLPMDQVVAPYDQTLKDAGVQERLRWAVGVVDALKARHGDLGGITFEIHAGRAYRDELEPMLRGEGAHCTCPVEGLSMGQRLAYYAGRPASIQSALAASKPASLAAVRAPTALPGDLRALLYPMRGTMLETATGTPFLVTRIDESGVIVVPESTKKPRPVRWGEVTDAYLALRRAGTMTISDVRACASEANPAYVFALLAQLPLVTLLPGRPARLVIAVDDGGRHA